jgi:hypothetical protein
MEKLNKAKVVTGKKLVVIYIIEKREIFGIFVVCGVTLLFVCAFIRF